MNIELDTLNKVYLELSQFVTATTSREVKFYEALKEANQLLRSAYQIAHRKGEKTNWETFEVSVEAALKKQLDILNTPLPHET